MDWFSWLSKSHLQPPFIHEYATAFSHNQLEEDDISYFNHEFLQSMGISIAKHRLEILKLARKSSCPHPMFKLIATIKKTKRALGRYVRTWVHRNDSAMVTVKRRSYSLRWKAAMMKRSNSVNNLSDSLDDDDLRLDDSKEDGGEHRANFYSDDEDDGDGHRYWSGRGVEEIKWDAMFENLKPT
ncbi:hypothetical protein E3N88_15346 [Mikania micrantha]|uniref:SAM domain-containing protein n=1 Tax=Mikania micrantha TaxID=192012 RepID=A0A5N6NXY1_9ASTR|nr:hypothetical protein E3N88_15346 [Mikania micrantha]